MAMRYFIGLGVLALFAVTWVGLRYSRPNPISTVPATKPASSAVPASNLEPLMLKQSPLSCDAQGCTLPLRIKTPKVCRIGDYQIMLADMSLSPRARLLLSIEPLRSGETLVPGAIQELTLQSIAEGKRTEMRLPPLKQAALLGVFICKDTASGSGRCLGKPVLAPNALRERNVVGNKKPGFHSSETTYFFQPFFAANGSLYYSPDEANDSVSTQVWQKRLEYFSASLDEPATLSLSESILEMLPWLALLHSVPLSLAEGEIQLQLPSYDSACSGG